MSIFEQYVELHTAVEKVADIFDGMDIGYETFSDFTCDEIEAIWAMLDSADRKETANRILDWHADGDDEGDAHYKGDGHE